MQHMERVGRKHKKQVPIYMKTMNQTMKLNIKTEKEIERFWG